MKHHSSRQNTKSMLLFLFIFLGCLAFFVLSCGERRGKSSGGDGGGGPINAAFQNASAQHGIPLKLLKAVAFYESDMSAEQSAVPYLNTASAEDRRSLGFTITETAFGVSRKKLGIYKNEKADELDFQIEAYAKYLKDNIKNFDKLKPSLATPTDHYLWIWEISKLHRGTHSDGRNVQSVWANGIIATLNKGQTWQNDEGTETVELRPASPQINIENFPPEALGVFNLALGRAEVYGAKNFPLYRHPNNLPNAPTHIEVIHCPMSLSACLEIQNINEKEDNARLRAHFVIPPFEIDPLSPDSQEVALQVTPMDFSVELTNSQGDLEEKSDAVVIMLTGKSGRYINGKRMNANPSWFTPRQLQSLGMLVKNICQVMAQNYDGINIAECRTPHHSRGIQFHAQAAFDPTFKWGDIPDFEETIFDTYIKANDSITDGEAKFEFSNRAKRFPARHEFRFTVRFPLNAQKVRVEQAVRCPGGRIVWDSLASSSVNGKIHKTFATEIHDGGPNGNGQHFLRVKVYDDTHTLVAWSIDQILVYNFDPTVSPVAPDTCSR